MKFNLPSLLLLWSIYDDNLSNVLLVVNPILHSKCKHFELDLHFIRDHVTKGKVQISNIPTHAQVDDILTKLITSSSFVAFRSKLRIVDGHTLSLRGDVRSNQMNGT